MSVLSRLGQSVFLLAYLGFGVADVANAATATDAIRDVHAKVHFAGETGGGEEAIQRALSEGVEKLDSILSDPAYDPSKDRTKNGWTPLQLAAAMGYPEIVDSLVADKRIIAIINEKDSKGLTALDRAITRRNLLLPIINPAVKHRPFSFIPFVLRLSYFSSEQAPYERVIATLRTKGAVQTIDFRQFYADRIRQYLPKLEKASKEEEELADKYQEMIEHAEKWLRTIEQIGSEDELVNRLAKLAQTYTIGTN